MEPITSGLPDDLFFKAISFRIGFPFFLHVDIYRRYLAGEREEKWLLLNREWSFLKNANHKSSAGQIISDICL